MLRAMRFSVQVQRASLDSSKSWMLFNCEYDYDPYSHSAGLWWMHHQQLKNPFAE